MDGARENIATVARRFKAKPMVREFLAEMMGTFILMVRFLALFVLFVSKQEALWIEIRHTYQISMKSLITRIQLVNPIQQGP